MVREAVEHLLDSIMPVEIRTAGVPDPVPESVFVITAYQLGPKALRAAPAAQETTMTQTRYPEGWDEARVRRVLEYYEGQSDDEAIAEDEAAYEATTHTTMEVPVELVPAVRELIAKRQAR